MSFFPDASIGTPGSPPPGHATYIAGTDGTDLRPVATDADGKQRVLLYDAAGNAITSTAGALDVNIGGGLANPLPTTDAADGSTGAAIPSKAIQVAGSDGTDLRALAMDTSGRAKVLLYDAAGNALTSSGGALNVNISSGGGPFDENLIKLAGTAIDVNSGNKSAGTQRVVLATDQPAFTTPMPTNPSQTNSGDALKPFYIGNKALSRSLSAAGSTNYFTAAAFYYITSFTFAFDLTSRSTIAGSSTVELFDSTDGIITAFFPYLPNAATPPAGVGAFNLPNPPGFFYHSSTSGSTLSLVISGGGTLTILCACTITYGFTTVAG